MPVYDNIIFSIYTNNYSLFLLLISFSCYNILCYRHVRNIELRHVSKNCYAFRWSRSRKEAFLFANFPINKLNNLTLRICYCQTVAISLLRVLTPDFTLLRLPNPVLLTVLYIYKMFYSPTLFKS